MNERVRKTLLQTIARLAKRRDECLNQAKHDREEAERDLHSALAMEEAAQAFQDTIAQLTETYGLTEEMAAPYRQTFAMPPDQERAQPFPGA